MTFRSLALSRVMVLGLAVATLSGAPASAQGFFDMLFGGATERSGQRQYIPPQASAYSDPYNAPAPSGYGAQPSAGGGTGRVLSYCVRLCDGRYFPMQRQGNASSVQLCNAFCPASKTQVFNGSQIDHAASNNGARYADLDHAFVYRDKIVPGCTCNGKDSFGLAKIDVANDPTLRPGDIVATGDNVKVALTAMAAAKERREASIERPALRGVSRRVATRPGVAPADTPEPDDRPED